MKEITGGVCAAKGFTAAGVHCGIRRNTTKKDLALIVSEKKASAACCYTRNLVKGAPLLVTESHISDGYASAVICNSGNANTCNADGIEIAEGMCALVEKTAGIPAGDVVVASTGVIGQPLSLAPVEAAMPALVSALGDDSDGAASAIMTTDTKKKEIALEFELGGRNCRIGGIAKGSGMIHPNMATMLAFVTTDAAVSPEMLRKALSAAVCDTFNMLSIDGDTSTNDMVCVLANGLAGNELLDSDGDSFAVFSAVLTELCARLCRMLAADGEGATRLLVCEVGGAADKQTAVTVAKSVICSSLFKAAIFGADANWGRVLCAIGYSGAAVDVGRIGVSFSSAAGDIVVCENGSGVPFDEDRAKQILLEKEITVIVSLNSGNASATAWGCDLTYDYVRINGDYRS